MADIAPAGVSYVILKARRLANSETHNLVRISFGNATDTVPAGGLPLVGGKLGCPSVVESVAIVNKGLSGYSFSYDKASGKLIILQDAATAGPSTAYVGAIPATVIEAEVIGW